MSVLRSFFIGQNEKNFGSLMNFEILHELPKEVLLRGSQYVNVQLKVLIIVRGLAYEIVSFRCPHRGAKITLHHPIDFDALISIFLVPTCVDPQFFRKRPLKLLDFSHFGFDGIFDLTIF